MATHSSYHDAQQLIDQKIADLTAQMQQVIRPLKTRRNELAPVSKLPDEVFLHIFLILRDSSGGDLRDWHQVTYICQYWRRVAVGSPLLWTRLYNAPPALTRLMLERSQSAPLEVELCIPSTNKHTIRTLPIVLRELNRIRTLTLDALPTILPDTVYDILAGLGRDGEAPLLESLTIGMGGYSDGPPPASGKVLTDVFRPTRRLRKLRFLNGYHDWVTLPLPSLTHLHLHGDPLGTVSSAQFIEALRHMQNLEILEIDMRHLSPTPRLQPVLLPCLGKLEIWDKSQVALEWFLSLLVHPKLHQLGIAAHRGINTSAFAKWVLSLILKASFGLLEFLRIYDHGITITTSSRINIYDDDTSSSFIDVDNYRFYPDENELDDNDGSQFNFPMDILSCITLFDLQERTPIRHVCLECWDAPVGEFTHLFASLPHLETIDAYDEAAPVLFNALDIASASDGAIPNTPIPFPKLQSIIWRGQHNHKGRLVPILSAGVFNDLYSGLLSRRSHGAPVMELDLVDCERLDNGQARQLNEIGVIVVVRRFGVEMDSTTD